MKIGAYFKWTGKRGYSRAKVLLIPKSIHKTADFPIEVVKEWVRTQNASWAEKPEKKPEKEKSK